MQRGPAGDKGARCTRMERRAGGLQRVRPFGIGARCPAALWVRPEFGRGCSSGVEHDLAKVGVEGSNPFARSKILLVRLKLQKIIASRGGRAHRNAALRSSISRT